MRIMECRSVLKLIKKTYEQDALGQSIPVETSRDIYCNLRSVSRAEWAAAGQLGLNAELVATMFAPDYLGEEIAELRHPAASVESSYLLDADGRQLRDADAQLLREAGDQTQGAVVRYGIYRTYLSKGNTLELYLERKAGVTNG